MDVRLWIIQFQMKPVGNFFFKYPYKFQGNVACIQFYRAHEHTSVQKAWFPRLQVYRLPKLDTIPGHLHGHYVDFQFVL